MKNGFTLIELLVYMAIMGLIIVVAGRVFSDSTSMRVRTQSMAKATEETNRVAEIIKEDLSQMGTKVWYNNAPAIGEFSFKTIAKAYMDPKPGTLGDSSSFNLWHNTSGDKIEFKKIAYSDEGKYIGTRLITWYVDNKILYRSCATIDPSSNAPNDPESETCPAGNDVQPAIVIMAENVEKFTLYPSKPLNSQATTDNSFTLIKSQSGTSTGQLSNNEFNDPEQKQLNSFLLSGFTRNENLTVRKYNEVLVGSPNSGPICKKFNLKKYDTYSIKFETYADSMMALFVPDFDHIAVGFRKSNNIIQNMPDFMFYPPQENKPTTESLQYFEFSVPNNYSTDEISDVCVAFTFAFYSGSPNYGPHKGNLIIRNFELLNKKDKAYKFVRDDEPNYAEESGSTSAEHLKNKKNAKAFELILEINKKGEVGSTRIQKTQGGDWSGYIIPVPNNGIVPQEVL